MDMSGDILGSSHIPEESKDLIREEKEVQEESEEEN